MSSSKPSFQNYDREEAEEYSGFLLTNAATAKDFINQTTDPDAIRYLVEDYTIDVDVPGAGTELKEAILTSETAPLDVKQTVAQRNADLGDVLVPDTVERNARTALAVGKPIVLYGPTGTGKTYFAKQLALETCVDYEVHTATPTWTPADITGSIQPETKDGKITYHRRAGCVSQGIQEAERYGDNYAVIIDEITRADISQVFGPLYTAIEDHDQVIFRDEEGTGLTLTDDLKLICTMNMSDRTVNELDNAITRRFAMVELSRYDDDARTELFDDWIGELDPGPDRNIDTEELKDLFENHHRGINDGTTTNSEGGIMEFGPMHYVDVTKFLKHACEPGGPYAGEAITAVGQAFATYVTPRLLNTASLPQINRIASHYETLDDQFRFDMSAPAELARRQAAAEERDMGVSAYE
ncbi:AAA family ATPase [Halorubrum sp. CGM4_25_10-8A]|uniref:AAA family ATPase n=1 Tax=Halorubrum sp. CGM4_25_10-8A TaxID=2518116 RepID=UPI0010F7E273|nr:AAA family ATPase [Halorubrum sp. CGM4_25_10-8A]TKX40029.1 AAA family ATPase [Halorubrum sp. CGM4_25_10-8A]